MVAIAAMSNAPPTSAAERAGDTPVVAIQATSALAKMCEATNAISAANLIRMRDLNDGDRASRNFLVQSNALRRRETETAVSFYSLSANLRRS